MSRLKTDLADTIGNLRSQIHDLQTRLKETEGLLKDLNVTTAEGEYYRVAISYAVERRTTNWKNIALRSNPSYQLMAANTKLSLHDRITVSALPKH